jgi:hypothetical protein
MKHPLFKGNQFLQREVAPASESESLESEEETLQRQEAGKEAATPYSLPVQAKLTIGAPGDKYEQEADRVASQVVKQINSPEAASSSQGQSVQRMEEPVEELQRQPSISDLQRTPLPLEVQRVAMPAEEELQAKSILQRREAIAGGEASTDLDTAINSARGGGQSLDAGLQRSMGQAMGADFSGVKVHTDAKSDQLNQSIQAKAFTTGQDVFFRQGEYNPGNRGGQELIAHELTHVVQQNGGAVQRSLLSQQQLSQHSASKITLPSVGDRVIQLMIFEENTGEYGELNTNNEKEVFEFLGLYKDGDLENDKIDARIWNEIKNAIKSGQYNQEKAEIEEILVQCGIATNEELGTSVEGEKISDEDRLRMEEIDKMHAKLYEFFQSDENKEKLKKIAAVQKNSPQFYVIYRGEWYERALSILKQGTFGGLPKAESDKLLNVTDELFQKNAQMQKERGDDKPKEVVNEWTTNLEIAQQYGKKFVTLVAFVGKDNPKISHPKEDTGRSEEQGVMADSRMEVLGIAILNMNNSPDYTKKLKGGS